MLNRICVFTGSSPGAHSEYADAAKKLGTELVTREYELVYGGANVGLMGIIADAVLARGGKVTGVIPADLAAREIAHEGLSELRIVSSMHERKRVMSELSSAIIALPGGLGTLEELFEMLTWGQLGIHKKPCGLLNIRGYFDQLLGFLDHAQSQRFIAPEHRNMLLSDSEATTLLDQIEDYSPPSVEKWLDRGSS
jgi:uncharacterized protein (TIGR00730 family)